MSSSQHLRSEERPFIVRNTNVSNPSIVVAQRASQQSLTASEDYYSLSDGSSVNTVLPTGNAVSRPHQSASSMSQYRTPMESHEAFIQNASVEPSASTNVRSRIFQANGARQGYAPIADSANAPHTAGNDDFDVENLLPAPLHAHSSAARDLNQSTSPPTPGIDDVPFIRFALEQLTRDEEVRGSRAYAPISEGPATAERSLPAPQSRYSANIQGAKESSPLTISSVWPTPRSTHDIVDQPLRHDDHSTSNLAPRGQPAFAEVPLSSGPNDPDLNVFVPVTPNGMRHTPTDFVPGLLRPIRLGLFLVCVLAYTACLIFCAVWSPRNSGLTNYASFGDGRYFVFRYLPSLLGIVLLYWLFQIELSLYRIAPYIAMASTSVNNRHRGIRLPLVPRGFLHPYLGHFRAGQPIVGVFLLAARLQIFSMPLLASSFNVYYFGQGSDGQWRWVTNRAIIWVVIALYGVLFLSGAALLVWLRRINIGLKWDPRSLADVMVLLERSNALGGSRTGEDVARLGYWHTTTRPTEVFHTYGITGRVPRQYAIEGDRIREKSSLAYLRMSDYGGDLEKGESRESRERMLRDPTHLSLRGAPTVRVLPWYVRSGFALLWQVAAIVFLIAFLVVSYLPSTRVRDGFSPQLPAFVSNAGYSATNFLYSFLPSLLATICLLVLLNIDHTYRRLQPFAALRSRNGASAEKSLLLSYSADLPGLVSLAALANGHLRIAILSFVTTFIAPVIVILAGGVFWTQFYIPTQSIRIYAHMPAYYALTVFVSIYAISYLAIHPSKTFRHLRIPPSHITGSATDLNSFISLITLLHQTKLLDNVAFHAPTSRLDLVTRLLSTPAQTPMSAPGRLITQRNAASSKTSLAHGIRGFGGARRNPASAASANAGPLRYALARFTGRDGREYFGIDRVTE